MVQATATTRQLLAGRIFHRAVKPVTKLVTTTSCRGAAVGTVPARV
jgi:hypothetical protein